MRSLLLLQALVGSPDGLSVRQLAERTGQSRSTVHRMLQELAEAGMAEQTDSGGYRLGPRIFEFAATVLARSSIVDVADRIMQELVDLTNETAYVAMLTADGRHGVHVHRVDSPEPLRYLVPRGTRFPLHAGAAGKAMLAFLAEDAIPDELERITANTVVARTALDADLAEVRRHGYAVTFEERVKGATGVAAPLRVRDRVVGSLTLSVPVARIPEAGLEVYGPAVVEFADRLSTAMAALGRAEFGVS